MAVSINYIRNRNLSTAPGPDWLTVSAGAEVRRFHESMAAFAPTQLKSLKNLAKQLGVKAIYVKDESTRFGLKAFKALGASWAITRVICRRLGLDYRTVTFDELRSEKYREAIQPMVFASATDGNHGKGVAWTAHQLGCRAYIFMPRGTVEARRAAILAAGATECSITDLTYDDTVRLVAKRAEQEGWTVVQDTAWEGYEEVPRYIAEGYMTMAAESLEALREQEGDSRAMPTHVFLQAGVGAMAGSVAGYLINAAGEAAKPRPVISLVEPAEAACFYDTALIGDGRRHPAKGNAVTIMAGLNCGEIASMVWPILRDFVSYYLAMEDYAAAEGMRQLAHPAGDDPAVTAGESGASGFGAARLILAHEELKQLREEMGLDENSILLLYNTEGDTDPENYRRIVEEGAWPLP